MSYKHEVNMSKVLFNSVMKEGTGKVLKPIRRKIRSVDTFLGRNEFD